MFGEAARKICGRASLLLPFHDDGGGAVASAERAAGAVRQRDVAIPHLHRRMRLAAQLAHRLDHLGQAAAVRRVVVAQAPAVRVERELAGARDQVAVADEFAALALFGQKPRSSSCIKTVMVKLS